MTHHYLHRWYCCPVQGTSERRESSCRTTSGLLAFSSPTLFPSLPLLLFSFAHSFLALRFSPSTQKFCCSELQQPLPLCWFSNWAVPPNLSSLFILLQQLSSFLPSVFIPIFIPVFSFIRMFKSFAFQVLWRAAQTCVGWLIRLGLVPPPKADSFFAPSRFPALVFFSPVLLLPLSSATRFPWPTFFRFQQGSRFFEGRIRHENWACWWVGCGDARKSKESARWLFGRSPKTAPLCAFFLPDLRLSPEAAEDARDVTVSMRGFGDSVPLNSGSAGLIGLHARALPPACPTWAIWQFENRMGCIAEVAEDPGTVLWEGKSCGWWAAPSAGALPSAAVPNTLTIFIILLMHLINCLYIT